MCGIIGAFHTPFVEQASIDAALRAIYHRGPDDAGQLRVDAGFLAMRRLSIIDKVGGHQPISNEDGSISVVQNGEIYNYRELARELRQRGHKLATSSDTEVLVHLYEDYGAEMVKQLRGMFAFALWDQKKRRLLLARDRFGKKPLYYSRRKEGIMFASELKALLPLMQAVGWEKSISSQAIYNYLSLGYIPQPATIYQEVHSLPPATTLIVDTENAEPIRYWQPTPRARANMPTDYDELLELVRVTIRDAVQLRLRSDVPLGVLLSGGLDSSIIALEAARSGTTSIETFTVASGGDDLDESNVAAKTASRLGLRHTLLPVKIAPANSIHFLAAHFDQPFADPSAIPTHAICKCAKEKVTVILSGDGGDEVFGGYRRYLAAHKATVVRRLPRAAWRALNFSLSLWPAERRSRRGFLQRFTRGMSLSPAERYLAWTADMLLDGDKRNPWHGGCPFSTESLVATFLPEHLSPVAQAMDGDCNLELPGALLVKMDMASMAASVEARSPFLDHVVADVAAGIDEATLFSRGRTKAVLRDAYASLLPAEITTAPKRGFEIPLEQWLQGELQPLLHDTVCARDSLLGTYLDRDFIRLVVNQRILPNRNWAALTYSLLMLELWLRNSR